MSILKLFCHVDDFCQLLVTRESAKLPGVTRRRGQAPRLSLSEVMTLASPLAMAVRTDWMRREKVSCIERPSSSASWRKRAVFGVPAADLACEGVFVDR